MQQAMKPEVNKGRDRAARGGDRVCKGTEASACWACVKKYKQVRVASARCWDDGTWDQLSRASNVTERTFFQEAVGSEGGGGEGVPEK